jgi:plastocyanin domain-containing protein
MARNKKNKTAQPAPQTSGNGLKIGIGLACIVAVLGILIAAQHALAPEPAAPRGATQQSGEGQILRMNVVSSGYSPSTLTAKAGEPITWLIDGSDAQGCAQFLVAPELGISERLDRGENRFELGSLSPGSYEFSCSMGMFKGTINVV